MLRRLAAGRTLAPHSVPTIGAEPHAARIATIRPALPAAFGATSLYYFVILPHGISGREGRRREWRAERWSRRFTDWQPQFADLPLSSATSILHTGHLSAAMPSPAIPSAWPPERETQTRPAIILLDLAMPRYGRFRGRTPPPAGARGGCSRA